MSIYRKTNPNNFPSPTRNTYKAYDEARRLLTEQQPGALAPAANATPDAVSLHALLRDYLAHDAKCVAMEVSSHGLAQGRVNGVHFDIAVLTNLSRDHLDYHGDMASYAAAKAGLTLFRQLPCRSRCDRYVAAKLRYVILQHTPYVV